ncbi:MAG: hypothetical protein EOM76_12835, partial [Sphingobacteriia bacterium]|nr:hypothetical protein [Sphingobacteriia bacterium]
MVSYSQWCRIEGTNIPNIEKQYGVGRLKNLSNYPIFYGTPEIQIHNPSSLTNGCRYLLVPVSSIGWSTVQEIDDNFTAFLQKINDQNKSANLGVFYYRPFVVTESTLIFHNDSTKDLLSLVGMVFVDQYATPEIKRIGVAYNGKNVKIGDKYEDSDLLVTAIYEDGTTATIEPMGYKVFDENGNESKTISKIGGNLFTVSYTANGITYTNTFSVPGIKKITGISGIYDGPKVGVGNTVNKKYFIISVLYS